MGIRVDPAEVKRWEAAGLVAAAPPRRPASSSSTLASGPPVPWRVALLLPGLKLVSRSNSREHWAARHRRDRAEAASLEAAWRAAGLTAWRAPLPLVATLTRSGGRPMDDDNLAEAFKALRDALAALLHVDDADDRVRWRCRQRPGPHAVRMALAGR